MARNVKQIDDDAALGADAPVWGMIKTLANDNTDESRLLELYYWSQEPGVMEMIRAYLEMEERARLALGNFMLTAQPQSIMASRDASGALVLSHGKKPGPGNGSQPASSRPEKRTARRS